MSGTSKVPLLSCIALHITIGLIVRAFLILYGEFHDQNNNVPYTDVDYHVITDAARHVYEGQSPFLRYTYRYTPFLAFLMLPNIILHFFVGKFIFSLFDTIAAFIIYKSLHQQGYSVQNCVKCALLWLYNPLVIGISTRGSPESVIVTVVLLVYYFYRNNKPILCGCALGLAVHLKLYPIIYSLPLYLAFEKRRNFSLQMFYPTKPRIEFAVAAVFTFAALTAYGIFLYGEDYVSEGFYYHLLRVDTRHNFSVYFYLLYLTVNHNIPALKIVTFVPQMVVVVAYGVVYGTREDLVLAMFAQTVLFVTFNKVVTSQYFLWYLVFVPLLCLRFRMSRFKAIFLPCLWLGAQAAWLLPAYLFEFKGIDAFLPIWLESIAFFCCNVGILMSLLSSYCKQNIKCKTQ